jgi:hypothetical protein
LSFSGQLAHVGPWNCTIIPKGGIPGVTLFLPTSPLSMISQNQPIEFIHFFDSYDEAKQNGL